MAKGRTRAVPTGGEPKAMVRRRGRCARLSYSAGIANIGNDNQNTQFGELNGLNTLICLHFAKNIPPQNAGFHRFWLHCSLTGEQASIAKPSAFSACRDGFRFAFDVFPRIRSRRFPAFTKLMASIRTFQCREAGRFASFRLAAIGKARAPEDRRQ